MNRLISSIIDLLQDRQHRRILRLAFPHHDAPAFEFLISKIDAAEGVSRDFEYTVELLCDNPDVPLKDMLGKLLAVELVCGDGSVRYFTGYVFSFQRKKSDGSITFYEARLGPWLRYLSLRKDNYVFHGATLREQTESIFSDYGAYQDWDWKVVGDDPPMTDAFQFDETDFNYLSRRWEAAGWLYWYEHSAEGHKLVLSDDSTAALAIDGGAEVRFQSHGGSAEEDAIDVWSPLRTTAPSVVALTSFDFKNSRPTDITVPTLGNQGTVPAIESYEYIGAYGCRDANDGDLIGQIRMEEFEGKSKHVSAEGNNRHIQPGRYLTLIDHFSYLSHGTSNDFLILAAHHSATNNYFQESGTTPHYRNTLTCTRKDVPWRPGRNFNSTNTRILAPQTATVVGPSGPDSIHTDEYGRVRVQFHWDRVGSNDERSSAWIRVSSAWAGAELGALMIPRVGTEVIVQWLGGCPDRPVITGALFNQQNMPPWAVPHQQALSGFRSRELAPDKGNSPTGRSNHLVLDDTNGEIQAQLKSDHLHSQLSLGFISNIDDNRGRSGPRGEGWELRTDGHGVVRAGAGMLISTDARQNGVSHAKDIEETAQRLATATDLHAGLFSIAEQHDSAGQDPAQPESAVADIKAQQEAVRGMDAKPFPELSEPHLAVGSPAGIEITSGKSTHVASSRHTAISSGKSMSIASAENMFASIGKAFRLFVHKAGLKLIAAAGKVSVQAQSDDVEVIANKVLALLSESDWVDIRGKKGVRLHGGDHMLEISETTQFFTTTPVLFNGNLETLPAKSVSQAFNEKRYDHRFDQEIYLVDIHGKPMKDVAFDLIRSDGTVISGKTGQDGSTGIQKGTGMESYTIRWKGELP